MTNIKETMKKILVYDNILLCAIIPIMCAMIMLLMNGMSIRDFYLPSSQWNDEIVYYKEVEGIVNWGEPLGYFGYNESTAKVGNLGTWSPVLLILWIFFGKLFGWNILSPIICNLMLLTIAMLLFGVFAKPDKRQCIWLAVLYFAFQTITRFALSGLAETSVYFLIIIWVALYTSCEKNPGKKNLVFFIFLVSIILSLMRPYYAMLFVWLFVFWWNKKRRGLSTISLLCLIASSISYIWINKNMCAPYFINLFNVDWILGIIESPITGIRNVIFILMTAIRQFFLLVGRGVTTGDLQGVWCATYLLLGVYLSVSVCKTWKEKNDNNERRFIKYACFGVFYIAMFCACALLFDIWNGSKHFVELIVMGMLFFVLDCNKQKTMKTVAAIIGFMYICGASNDYNWKLPAKNDEIMAEISCGQDLLDNNMAIENRQGELDEWDYTVIWVLSDDGGSTKWQDLYSLPSGMGLNLCDMNYVQANYDDLKSKYIATNQVGSVNQLCENKGAKLIGEFGEVHIWQIRN